MVVLRPSPATEMEAPPIRAFLSFAPYLRYLQQKVEDPGQQFVDFYRQIIQRLESTPDLLKPVEDLDVIHRHEDLFQLVASTIFPLSEDPDLQYFSLGTPYRFQVFFYSRSYAQYFSPDESGFVVFPPERPLAHFQAEYELMAYRMLCQQLYGKRVQIPERKTNQWIDKRSGVRRYSRIHIDESFIDVHPEGELPPFPEACVDPHTGKITDMDTLRKQLPLSGFRFEGFITRRSIVDVTVEECIKEVKNALIDLQSDNPEPGYEKVRAAVETLLGLRDVRVSLCAFPRLNQRFVYCKPYLQRSILVSAQPGAWETEHAYAALASLLVREKRPVFFSNLADISDTASGAELRPFLAHAGEGCYLVAPLIRQEELIGMMEVASPQIGVLNRELLKKLEPVYTFFEMVCESDLSRFRMSVESLVKEKFTSLQPIVEWKFLEEAWKHLNQDKRDHASEIGVVRFEGVYPVYGAIDIRNSSTERNRCMQEDLHGQLDLIDETIHALSASPPPQVRDFLQNLQEKNRFFRNSTLDRLGAEEEARLNDYLEHEVKTFFRHLAHSHNGLSEPAARYLAAVDPERGHMFTHRRRYEESIGRLNETISGYLDKEQQAIARMYPHYFEKFRTDGVEYNMYIGETLTPHHGFDYLYLRSIRLWQLVSMVEIARRTEALQAELPLPLQTTQLVLVYGTPICISFRRDERRFDVDGAESVRFEILKKRLDKVRIEGSGERLTQPGKIAIVYLHEKEAQEYAEYVQHLHQKGYVTKDVEKLSLEDVQGISGLKAIRLSVIC